MVNTELIYELVLDRKVNAEDVSLLLKKLASENWISSILGVEAFEVKIFSDEYLNVVEDEGLEYYPDTLDQTFSLIEQHKHDSLIVFCQLGDCAISNYWLHFCSAANVESNELHTITIYNGKFEFNDYYCEDLDAIETQSLVITLSVDRAYSSEIFTGDSFNEMSSLLNRSGIGNFIFRGSIQV